MLKASFSSLSLYASCPLKYRYLIVDRAPEPEIEPDWRRAPASDDLAVASVFDRGLGVAVHRALMAWQRGVDEGARPSTTGLLAAVRAEAHRENLAAADTDAALERLGPRLAAYAEGPWPRRHTLFLEQPARHILEDRGFSLQLSLRIDRVVRYLRGVAILDFKTVPPHALEMRADVWQLRTYALAAPELLGIPSVKVALFLIDLRGGKELEVGSSAAELAEASSELLECGRGIAAEEFAVGAGHPDRPCWACGFRLTCPSSLAQDPPRRRG